jgi:hypothetical protein
MSTINTIKFKWTPVNLLERGDVDGSQIVKFAKLQETELRIVLDITVIPNDTIPECDLKLLTHHSTIITRRYSYNDFVLCQKHDKI